MKIAVAAGLGLLLAGATLNAAPAGDPHTPRATVSIAHDRYDDIIWENDRTAHRIYARPLEKAEPPSSSGIDAWGKRVRWPVMRGMIERGDYHADHGDGVDFYGVHGSRGIGGLGIWYDNKLWTSRNYASARILQNGPEVARFEVTYAPWPVDTVRTVRETRRFTLPMGSNFTRMVSRIDSDRPGSLTVAIGLYKHPTSPADGTLSVDRATGRVSFWTPDDPAKGSMGVAVMVDPRQIAGVVSDYDNTLVLLNVMPGKPFVYYIGATWSQAPDFPTRAQWEAHVAAQRPSFDPAGAR